MILELTSKLFVFGCVLQSVVFAIMSFLHYKRKSLSSVLRFWLFVLLSMIYISLFSAYISLNVDVLLFTTYINPLLFMALFPLLYLYIQSLTGIIPTKRAYLYHFIPSIVFFTLTIFSLSILNATELVEFLQITDWKPYLWHSRYGYMSMVSLVMDAAFKIQAISYSILLFRLIKKHETKILNHFSYSEKINLRWVKFISAGLGLFGLSTFFLSLTALLNVEQQVFIFGWHLTIIIALGISANSQVEIFQSEDKALIINELHDISVENEPEQIVSVEIKETPLQRLKNELVVYFETEKPWLQPDLSLEDVCIKLQTNRNYLSKVINEDFDMNFYYFVNKYRIEEAKKLLVENNANHYSIRGIAETVGFKSISSFNTAFKKFEGITPSEYKKTLS